MTTPSTAAPAPLPVHPPGRKPVPTEYIGLVAFFALSAAVSWRMVLSTTGQTAGAMVLAAVLGYIGADFVSGLVHWGFDTWGSASTPIVGKTFIVPFRLHHTDEKEMTLHGFIATNGHNCLVTSPVLAGVLFIDMSTPMGAGLATFLFWLCFGTFLTNQFHKWAHEDELPGWVQFLQKSRLILSKPNHDVHHKFPHDSYYCITTGWLNWTLKTIRFYRVLEAVITAVTGAKPRVNDLEVLKSA